MELRILKYFVTVAREETITKAAQTLHITQPTLSRQLMQLEEEVGVPLFVRSSGNRRITLTTEGTLLLRRAEELIALEEKALQEIKQPDNEVSGLVSIGCGEIASTGMLAQIFKEVQADYPKIRFDIYTAAHESILDRLEDGLLDFGLLLDEKNPDRYAVQLLPSREHWVMLLRHDDPLAMEPSIKPSDVQKTAMILPQAENRQSEIRKWLGRKAPLSTISCNLTANAAVMVQQGLGIAPVIEGSVPFGPAHVVARPLDPPITMGTSLIWKKELPLHPAAQVFLDSLRRFIAGCTR